MLGSASLSVTAAAAIVPTSNGITGTGRQLALSFPSSQKSLLGFVSSNSNLNARSRSTSSFKTAVASVDSNQLSSSSTPPDKQESNKYYFVVANAKFMLDEEEHFQELMFERLRHYGERNKEQDFWLVIEPKFLDKFPDITKRLRRPAVALVSTNGPWITFMKLRLDRVLSGSYEADSREEALASNPTTLEFEKPEKWVAPYPKYEFGWWETFLPTGSKESKV
ncbi:Ycf54-like protein [Melia azedarach]|uniref:Ycf54-like protein n=1 Tax=Melia azedarach TaxID=155640 RepID=A0ACC1Y7P9_MELAZ|nr:Ycf54-like protein [Melia azedarach]